MDGAVVKIRRVTIVMVSAVSWEMTLTMSDCGCWFTLLHVPMLGKLPAADNNYEILLLQGVSCWACGCARLHVWLPKSNTEF